MQNFDSMTSYSLGRQVYDVTTTLMLLYILPFYSIKSSSFIHEKQVNQWKSPSISWDNWFEQ